MTAPSLHRLHRRLRADGEEGVALITVLLVTFVLLILVASTMAYAIGSMPISRRDQDWNAALTAAEAGLDDYLYRLNQNDQYYLYGQHPPPATGTCGAYPTLAAPPGRQPRLHRAGCRSPAPRRAPRSATAWTRPAW